MFQSVGFCDFVDAFTHMGRKEQFTYDALRALYDYLEQIEEYTGGQIELDVIALCCDYSEIHDNEEQYQEYLYDEDKTDDLIIARLSNSILVREG